MNLPSRLFAASFALVLLMLPAPGAHAWSTLGHRLVGELAQRHLTPTAATEVEKLLAGEPNPSLGGVASWADALRNTDPARFRQTSPWHYVNFPLGECDYQPERDCPNGQCVVAQIDHQRAILGDRKQPLAARRDALKFLVHLVGDVHQPLHAGNRPDKGGNGFQVSLRTDLKPEAYARKDYRNGVAGTNLHSVWDYYILGSRKFDGDFATVTPYANSLDPQPWPPMTDAAPSGPEAWAGESCRFVDEHGLYPSGHKLDSVYLDKYRPLAEQRVRRAAYRLAQLLNETLGQ